jgi:hypothetical protein
MPCPPGNECGAGLVASGRIALDDRDQRTHPGGKLRGIGVCQTTDGLRLRFVELQLALHVGVLE